MANTYTDGMSDGTVLTDAQLDTALTSLQLDLPNTALMTTTGSAGTFLKVSTPGSAAIWGSPSDPLPLGGRDYGLKSFASANQLVLQITGKTGGTPSTSTYPDFTFPQAATGTSTYNSITVQSARELKINASATLGFSGTATAANRVFVYAIAASSTSARVAACGHYIGSTGITDTTIIAASADTAGLVYATATLSAKPFIYLGYVEAARNSSGQWQSPTRVLVQNEALPTEATKWTGTTVGRGGVAISSGSGTFQSTSGTFVDVTNLSVTLTTTGRPVMLTGVSAASSGSEFGRWRVSGSAIALEGDIQCLRGTVNIGIVTIGYRAPSSASISVVYPPGSVLFFDTVAAGTYTYKIQVRSSAASTTIDARQIRLMAYEL